MLLVGCNGWYEAFSYVLNFISRSLSHSHRARVCSHTHTEPACTVAPHIHILTHTLKRRFGNGILIIAHNEQRKVIELFIVVDFCVFKPNQIGREALPSSSWNTEFSVKYFYQTKIITEPYTIQLKMNRWW